MYLALARKYRPQDFTQLIGQDAIVKTLAHALEHDRLHHAYLFCGARGVGKTSLARILSKSINCEKGPTLTPCQQCEMCVSITQGKSLDVQEIDGASNNSVDSVRELREQVKFLPTQGRRKIYIIDEVHMLSTAAFNALLKTLEEPPPHVVFIFATTEAQKIPITILSRCQKFDFRKLNTAGLMQHLENILKSENVTATPEALQLVARCAQGSVRDALSLLDQLINASAEGLDEARVREVLGLGERVLIQDMTAALVTGDTNTALARLEEADARGLDLTLVAEDILALFRALLLQKATGKAPRDCAPSEVSWLKNFTGGLEMSLLLAQQQILMNGLGELMRTEFPKTVLEITFVRLLHAQQMIDLTGLIAGIREKRLSGSATPLETRGARHSFEGSPRVGGSITEMPPASKVSPATSEEREAVQTAKSTRLEEDESVQGWYLFVKWLQSEKPQLAGILSQAIPLHFSSDKIEVGFAKDSPAKQLLLERRTLVEDSLQKHFARPVQLNIVSEEIEKKKSLTFAEEESMRQRALRDSAESEIRSHDAVKEMLERHGGVIREIKVLKK